MRIRVALILVGVLLAAGVLTQPSQAVPASTVSGSVSSVPQGLSTQVSPESAGATVRVSAVVEGVRLIVVGTDGRIKAIYSNTGDSGGGHPGDYTLRARSLSPAGTLLSPIPAGVLAQYEKLLPGIDWSTRGRVFAAD